MKISLMLVLAVAIWTAGPRPAAAAELKTKFDWGGQVRVRQESADLQSYTLPTTLRAMDQTLLRLRLWAQADTGRDIKVYVQLQDSRVFGSEAGTTANTANVDLHQGYLDVLNLFSQPVDLRAGRMELSYGDQRLVGPLDWSNIGRAFDGARLRGRLERATIDGFVTNVKQVADGGHNQYFWGAYVAGKPVPKLETDLYVFGRDFGDNAQTAEQGKKGNLSDRTVGARIKGTPAPWDYSAEAAWQFGRKAGQRVRAWAAALTGGYTFAGDSAPRLGAEYDYASGDANPKDNQIQTFDPLFPTGHLYQGYQDIFYWRNGHDIVGTISFKPAKDWLVKADYHKFLLDHSFDAWYDKTGAVIARDTTGASRRSVGDELDLTVKTKFRDVVGLYFGYSEFFSGTFARLFAANRNRGWAFFQATLDF